MDSQFETSLMDAVVRQFFENPPIVGQTSDGQIVTIPSRPTPVQVVAARLLSEKNAELLDAIMAAIDVDVLAGLVAAEVAKVLTAPEQRGMWASQTQTPAARKQLRERIDNRLVELMAQDVYARFKAAEEPQ